MEKTIEVAEGVITVTKTETVVEQYNEEDLRTERTNLERRRTSVNSEIDTRIAEIDVMLAEAEKAANEKEV